MNTDLRRSKRYKDFIPVSVYACKNGNNDREVGPFAGRIINISCHGACLLMSLGILESYNLYRSTYKNDSLHLEIQGSIPSNIDNFNLSGHPVWIDPFVLDDIRAFKMGVEFMSNADFEKSNEIIDSITAEPIDDMLALADDQ